MTVRSIICVCGTSIAIGLAGATAQQDSQPERTTRTLQPERTTTTTTGTSQVDDLLSKREGVWQVEVQLNKEFWSKMGSGRAHSKVDQTYITEPGERDRTPPVITDDNDIDRTDPNKPNEDQDDPANPWYNRPGETDTRTQPGLTDRPDRTTTTATTTIQPGMTRLTGYAESNLVLGSNCLQERIVVPMSGDLGMHNQNLDDVNRDNQDLENRDLDNRDLDTQPSTDAMGAMGDGYRAISFIQFNDDNRTYDMVFLSNHTEGMKYESGYFDAERNRIVFRGKHDMGSTRSTTDWSTRTDQPSIDWRSTDDNKTDRPSDKPAPGEQTDTVPDHTNRTPGQQPDTRPGYTEPGQVDRMQSPAHTGLKDVVVVLEFLDDDTHKVTMYDASSTSGHKDWQTDPSRDTDIDVDADLDDTDVDIDADIDDDRDLNDQLEDDRDDALDEPDLDDVQDDANDTKRDWSKQPSDTTRLGDQSMRSGEFGRIIYEATYTRAPSSMEASIRSMIEREITVASR